jgi:hypothetical protein
MELTFKKLGEYMEKEKTNENMEGRDGVEIVDTMSVGMHNAMSGKIVGNYDVEDTDLLDKMEEVEDDGSLDI